MKKNALEIYALAVCFVTMVCFVATLGVGLYSTLEILKPAITLSSLQYERFQSNDAFWNQCGNARYCSDQEKKKERPSESELTILREEAFSLTLLREQRDGVQGLIKAFIVIVIDIGVFLAHWSLARRAGVSFVADSRE